MEKRGFIYIWYDRKHKRYYIGCHWGTIDDGYICSSSWMKQAYEHRPQDFKRRILAKNIDRDKLLEEEYIWLQLISDGELGKKYYNLSKKHFGHWSSDENRRLIVGQKLSQSLKGKSSPMRGKKHTEETKQKLRDANIRQFSSEEQRQKHRQSCLDFWSTNENSISREHMESTKQKLREARSKQIITEDTKRKISEWHKNNPDHNKSMTRRHKISKSHKGKKKQQDQIEKMRKTKTGIKLGKKYKWTILGPDGTIYIEYGIDVFARDNGFCANNLRTRGKTKGFTLIGRASE